MLLLSPTAIALAVVRCSAFVYRGASIWPLSERDNDQFGVPPLALAAEAAAASLSVASFS